jgi:hypothetical protein
MELNVSKESLELIATRLKAKDILYSEIKITFYRRSEKDFLPYFTEVNNLVSCIDIGKPCEENWSFRTQPK